MPIHCAYVLHLTVYNLLCACKVYLLMHTKSFQFLHSNPLCEFTIVYLPNPIIQKHLAVEEMQA